MEDFLSYDASYELNSNLLCYLCSLPIPLNIFRGAINGKTNPLSLQYDHVIPKYSGGCNTIDNIKPTHRYCNGSKNRYEWTIKKGESAKYFIEKLLLSPMDLSWSSRRLDKFCIVNDCEKVARSGNYWEFCIDHARERGENPRVMECTVSNCSKNLRKSGLCHSHYKQLLGELPAQCSQDECKKQKQYNCGGYCSYHGRLNGVVSTVKAPGLQWKAAHVGSHLQRPSRACFWCVEIEKRCSYICHEELNEFLLRIGRDKLTKTSLTRYFSVPKRLGDHYMEIINDCHETGKCSYCLLLKECQDFYCTEGFGQ